MKLKNREVTSMSNKQLAAFLESLKIIAEQTNDPQQIKNALERIQGVLKNPK